MLIPQVSIGTVFNAFEIIVKGLLLSRTWKIKSMAQSITIRL